MRQSYGPCDPGPLVTKTGHVITEGELESWVAEAERGYDLASHRVPIGALAGPAREDTVESETYPGTYYHLRQRGDGTWSCDCPGYSYRQDCKHARRKQEGKPW